MYISTLLLIWKGKRRKKQPKAQCRWVCLSPNSITPTFTETSLRGKLWTQIMKVADTNGDKSWNHKVSVKFANVNHESREQKQSQHVEMFATKFVTSPRQTRLCRSNGIWSVTMHGKSQRQSRWQSPWILSQTQITKVCDTNHESRWRDLCRELSWFVSATFPAGKFRWKSQSRRNGIRA